MPIGLGAGLTVAKVVYDVVKSDKIEAEAARKNERAMSRIIAANGELKATEENMNLAVKKLMNKKNSILSSTMKNFLELYKNKMTIIFKDNAELMNIDFFTTKQLENLSFQISNVYLPSNPPTITPNVITGFLLGGVFGAVTGSMVDDANNNLSLVKMQSQKAAAIETQAKTLKLSYTVVIERVNRINDLLNRLNFLLLKTMLEVDGIFVREDNINKYTEYEYNLIGLCVNLAKAIKILIDAPIVDDNGNLTQTCNEALSFGNECINKIEMLQGN